MTRRTWRAFFWFTSASYIDRTAGVEQPPRFKVHARMAQDHERIVVVEIDPRDVPKLHAAAAEFMERTGYTPLERADRREVAKSDFLSQALNGGRRELQAMTRLQRAKQLAAAAGVDAPDAFDLRVMDAWCECRGVATEVVVALGLELTADNVARVLRSTSRLMTFAQSQEGGPR